jgi:hypothetical protein
MKAIVSPDITPIVSGNTSENRIVLQNANSDSFQN